ncbi:MAG: hypothetical protein WCK88_01730 [bacterium]
MKTKPRLGLIVLLFVLVVIFGIILFGVNIPIGNLFSRSVTPVDTVEGADPRPAVESLDTSVPDQTPAVDQKKLLQDLQQELIKTENDPDKAMELRRRIQILKSENLSPAPSPTTEVNNS